LCVWVCESGGVCVGVCVGFVCVGVSNITTPSVSNDIYPLFYS